MEHKYYPDDNYPQTQLEIIKSPWETSCLIIDEYIYNCHSTRGNKEYWRCHNYSKKNPLERCKARCVIVDRQLKALTGSKHNHPPHKAKIEKFTQKHNMRIMNQIKMENYEILP